jgi:hypothetical protein
LNLNRRSLLVRLGALIGLGAVAKAAADVDPDALISTEWDDAYDWPATATAHSIQTRESHQHWLERVSRQHMKEVEDAIEHAAKQYKRVVIAPDGQYELDRAIEAHKQLKHELDALMYVRGLPVRVDTSVPDGTYFFMQGPEVVAKLTGVAP